MSVDVQVIPKCAEKLGLKMHSEEGTEDKPCDIYWHSVFYEDMKDVVKSPDSWVSRFPGMKELARKVALTESIRSMQELFPEEYDFYPKSWAIPAQLKEFKEYCASKKNENWFIVKPNAGTEGKEIYLINSPEQLKSITDKQLVQEYMDEPFLLENEAKFDFRIHVTVKSIDPLSIYIARGGIVRFCAEKYVKPNSSNADKLNAHLTNYVFNKDNPSFTNCVTFEEEPTASKRFLETAFYQIEARGVDAHRMWHEVQMIVVKTVIAMVPELKLHYKNYFRDGPNQNCFQIIGLDILLKKDGTPILLEVNAVPSLMVHHKKNPEDPFTMWSFVGEITEIPLVCDTFLLVLDQLENHYNLLSSNERDVEALNHIASDEDNNSMKIKKDIKPHLYKIFPDRCGAACNHLLFLNEVVHLFTQFTTLKFSMTINLAAIKDFIEKCSLSDIISPEQLEEEYAKINYYFTGQENDTTTELPFHGFVQLLFHLARSKFGLHDNLLHVMQKLLAHCDSSLKNSS
ncbi:hypothetical protein FO519_009354 [Halicephalobus sp. NKZ332]|nr:hypothetical protein FO519_009354 [Halicephalobus sp. NKZ332]